MAEVLQAVPKSTVSSHLQPNFSKGLAAVKTQKRFLSSPFTQCSQYGMIVNVLTKHQPTFRKNYV